MSATWPPQTSGNGEPYEEGKWYLDGNLLYQVEQDGWWRGKPTWRNAQSIRLEQCSDELKAYLLAKVREYEG